MEVEGKPEGRVALNFRLAQSLAHQLRKHKIAVVLPTLGMLRSGAVLDHLGRY